MRLDQLLAEVEEVVVRQSVDKADETISILCRRCTCLALSGMLA